MANADVTLFVVVHTPLQCRVRVQGKTADWNSTKT